ncbi:MAG: S8 family serine peptidase, partial [Anaerolineales bacterium]
MINFSKKFVGIMVLICWFFSPVIAQIPQDDSRTKRLGEPQIVSDTKWLGAFPKVDSFIILLEGESLVAYEGDIPNLNATNPRATAGNLDVHSPDSMKYLNYLHQQQNKVISAAENALQRKLEITFRYDVILNGFAAKMSTQEAQQLTNLAGVRTVLPDELRQPTTDVSPGFIGADTLWADSGTTPGTLATMGEGMLVGIIDTGINMDHPSFADIGDDSYDHDNPFGSGVYKGLCDSDPTNFICNDKLVGVYAYTQSNESLYGEDGYAHGSHTASTAAGNILNLEYNGIPVTISGMAPHANIIAYDVCYSAGCPNSYSVAAVQQAVIDG